MYDYILSIKVGDGVNSLYRCEVTDGNGKKISEIDLPDKELILDWVRNNLHPLWINRFDESKIDVGKIKKELKNKC